MHIHKAIQYAYCKHVFMVGFLSLDLKPSYLPIYVALMCHVVEMTIHTGTSLLPHIRLWVYTGHSKNDTLERTSLQKGCKFWQQVPMQALDASCHDRTSQIQQSLGIRDTQGTEKLSSIPMWSYFSGQSLCTEYA